MTNINLVLSQELLDRVDEARGDVPRIRFVRRALEREVDWARGERGAHLAAEAIVAESERYPLSTVSTAREVMQRSPRYAPRRDVKPFQRGKP
jgi:hypothetical protein